MRHFLKDTNLYGRTQQKNVDYEFRKSLKQLAMSASCFTIPFVHCSGRDLKLLDSSSEQPSYATRKKSLGLHNTKREW
jgi:hypothetical protein